ncbi:hypothetical protein [Cohaesibacter sp. ES.047]|uniref:hypothetical protein n=1 Tax=Cohaesibacter sp. ES.047 TaxID=1798205 RepID=UPI0012FDED11|nr:hypothetical protein [Cohaesibacter sp. ES.047]
MKQEKQDCQRAFIELLEHLDVIQSQDGVVIYGEIPDGLWSRILCIQKCITLRKK